ncbi:MAG: ABC transporter ATP-binding protein [bacterium]|nr:ABC transporter ATP-binding protein [bacterium]
MIDLNGVTKQFESAGGTVTALNDFSLQVAAGEWLSVCGHSGSGKSTLLSLVGALTLPTSGSVTVAGRPVSSLSIPERAKYRSEVVGFVFQMFHLFPYLNVLDNVMVADDPQGSRRARAKELLEQFGMSHRLKHYPAQLSAGERQRTALARALLANPPLLLADEPTGNLDPANASEVLDIIDQFRQSGGTIVLATHDEAAAERGDRTIYLENGVMAVDRSV